MGGSARLRLLRLAALAVAGVMLPACSIRKVVFTPLDGGGQDGQGDGQDDGQDASVEATDAARDAEDARDDTRDAADTATDTTADTAADVPTDTAADSGGPVCGNNVLETGELCDFGPDDTAHCLGSMAGPALGCRFTVCGDVHINRAAREECDDGNATGGDDCDQQCRCSASLVPVMTSATAPSGTVSTSGVYVGSPTYDAWRAFDASDTSIWISAENQAPASVGYEWADGPRTVSRYAITYANGSITSRAPSAWTFEGWDGADWIVLDTRAGETGWAGFERRAFDVPSPGSYARYRLNITDDNDGSAGIVVISLGKVELIGCAPFPRP